MLCQFLDLFGLPDYQAEEQGQRHQGYNPGQDAGADEDVDDAYDDHAEQAEQEYGAEPGQVAFGGEADDAHRRE